MGFEFERQGNRGMKKIRSFALVAICLALGLTSCDRFGERTKDVIDAISIQNLSTGEKLLRNEISDVQLTLPQGWVNVRDSLRPDADLYVAREDRTMYVLVLVDSKRSEIGDLGLADNSSSYLSYLDWGLEQEQPKVPTSLTSLNGLNARQYEVRGRVDNLPIVYLHTTIEGEENYYQVVAWTTAENYAAAKGELQTVIGSFRGT